MNQFFLALLLVLSGICYWLWNENKILVANNAALEGAVATQEETIAVMQNDFSLQTEQLQAMTVKSQAAQRELNRYTQFIQNYELTAKVLADAVDLERKINKRAKHAFEDSEKLSDTIDNLDDGLQLQPNSN